MCAIFNDKRVCCSLSKSHCTGTLSQHRRVFSSNCTHSSTTATQYNASLSVLSLPIPVLHVFIRLSLMSLASYTISARMWCTNSGNGGINRVMRYCQTVHTKRCTRLARYLVINNLCNTNLAYNISLGWIRGYSLSRLHCHSQVDGCASWVSRGPQWPVLICWSTREHILPNNLSTPVHSRGLYNTLFFSQQPFVG